jgi:AcrR family transcriptional regulator
MALISFKLSSNLYLRDPQSTPLGQKIISTSVRLLDTLGFDAFTFRKLAEEIQSTEAGIYRYFENKHRLLLYLLDWYWSWLEYRIDSRVHHLTDPKERLRACLEILSEPKVFDTTIAYVDEAALSRIAAAEFEKTYLTKQVDRDNREGLFIPYKSLCNKIVGWVQQANPDYRYPRSLVSTLMLAVTHQLYYAEHLPSLTDINVKEADTHQQLCDFLGTLAINSIRQ